MNASDCWRELRQAVQDSGTFLDSKDLVDAILKKDPEDIVAAFRKLPSKTSDQSNQDVLKKFFDEHFDVPGSELQSAEAPDFQVLPPNFLPLVTDESVRRWALEVHGLWNTLFRKVSTSSLRYPQRHSLLHIPNGIVVPGERFRELYYWDSYWIIKGLLVSGMVSTATGMIHNLLHLLDMYGFVPNGARTYYLNRSQPPLLSAMIRAVTAKTGDSQLLQTSLPLLVREHSYWTGRPKGVVVAHQGMTHALSRYFAEWSQPRPESHREDEATAAGASDDEKANMYRQLASAAESGWDFSSRWLGDGHTLRSIRTTEVIPVDLNSFLYDMEVNIGNIAKDVGHSHTALTFEAAAAQRREAIQSLMWDESTGQWRDLEITGVSDCGGIAMVKQTACDSAANYVPLWAGVAVKGGSQATAALAAFKSGGLLGPAGISASTATTGQQWDSPNAWPPVQDLLIQGFITFGGDEGKQLAESIAQRWLLTMFTAWNSEGRSRHRMMEKYDAKSLGDSGCGGEYEVQSGFGWTNGVMLLLLDQFGWKQ